METRVVEDRETKNGHLELTRNYFAIDRTTNDVYYFGEDVDVYRNGKVFGHEGAWREGSASSGVKVGQKFYQEQARGVGMDRAEASASESQSVPTWVHSFDHFSREWKHLYGFASPLLLFSSFPLQILLLIFRSRRIK